MNKEKKDAIDINKAMKDFCKKWGPGAIGYAKDKSIFPTDIKVIPSGIVSLDRALGIGGLPKGRIIEFWGSEASGKSTLALHFAKAAQKAEPDKVISYEDAEHVLDLDYAERLGIDMERFVFNRPDSAEEALEGIELMARSGLASMIIVDSVPAMIPIADLERDLGEAQVGKLPLMLSLACKRLASILDQTGTIVVFINQIRQKVGAGQYENKEAIPGGNALKYYASLRMRVNNPEKLKLKDINIGALVSLNIVKNKFNFSGKKAEIELYYGRGYDEYGCLADEAVKCGVMERRGTWFYYQGENIGQGKQQVREYFNVHQELADQIRIKILASEEAPLEETNEEEK